MHFEFSNNKAHYIHQWNSFIKTRCYCRNMCQHEYVILRP